MLVHIQARASKNSVVGQQFLDRVFVFPRPTEQYPPPLCRGPAEDGRPKGPRDLLGTVAGWETPEAAGSRVGEIRPSPGALPTAGQPLALGLFCREAHLNRDYGVHAAEVDLVPPAAGVVTPATSPRDSGAVPTF